MAYKIFLSHSMAHEDLNLLTSFVSLLRTKGIESYLAERDWQPGTPLPQKIKAAIRASDCMVAFLTKAGDHSRWVHQEIGFAEAIPLRRIPIVEKGVDIAGFDLGREYVSLDRAAPLQTLHNLTAFLDGLKTKKEQGESIFVFGAILLGFIAIFGSGKK